MGKNEAYFWALPTCDGNKLYHFIVGNVFMFSTDDLRGTLIDIICYYYVLDITYPKVMYALLIFVQHFVFGITDTDIDYFVLKTSPIIFATVQ